MDYFLGTSIGGLTAFIFAIPAIVLAVVERGRVANVPLLVDAKTMWGRKLEKHEVFLVALLIHIVIGCLFGLIYVLFVKKGWLVFTNAPYTLLSLFIYATCAFVVTGLVIFPLLGMGIFGRREGKRVWLEMLASHYILGLGLWLIVQYYQPFFFVD
jgi:hypothetical protein